jgi:hypothetical protein
LTRCCSVTKNRFLDLSADVQTGRLFGLCRSVRQRNSALLATLGLSVHDVADVIVFLLNLSFPYAFWSAKGHQTRASFSQLTAWWVSSCRCCLGWGCCWVLHCYATYQFFSKFPAVRSKRNIDITSCISVVVTLALGCGLIFRYRLSFVPPQK